MDFDGVVYGATGFTGRLAARFLSRKQSGLQIAIAGRNASKLEAIAQSCERPPAIIIADSSRPETVEAMVKRTKVVASFAGPFSIYGEPVLAACVKLGRHYCDITGETPWVKSMILRYQEDAQRSGACLIPFAGFDSVPAELTTFLALEEARAKGYTVDSMVHYYRLKGGLNGGTLASALTIAEQRIGRALYDPNLLLPEVSFPRGKRAVMAPTYEPVLHRWSSPFFMSPINTAVVRRSMYLRALHPPAPPAFDYEERMVFGDAWKGRMEATGMTLGLAGFALMTGHALGRKILQRFGPEPGEGPSDQARARNFYKGQLISRSQGEAKSIVTFECALDPGNEATITFASSIASLLAEGAQGSVSGFTTPSVAFARPLIDRLKQEGCVFGTQTLSRSVQDKT
jgi:short subunit dehydrogenase-like uncharacterized protein